MSAPSRAAPGRAFLAFAAALALGCAHGAGAWADPAAVRIEDVRARFTPAERGDFEVDFAIENGSGTAAAVAGIEWEVWLGGRWFAAGTLSLSEALPPRGQRRFTATLPVVFRRSGSDPAQPTSVEIGVRGNLLIGAEGRVEKVPFQDRRRIAAAYLPAVGGRVEDR
ncbi:MAG TPA: hypothetical protein VE618_01210 [Myxococcaceae bacterium]|nr:hypothetical protein [Myxococcaceae bacterium]